MNYSKIYESLIQDARNNPKEDLYKEKHHIIPLCMGGLDDVSNLVELTARQHYLAHWLLYKIHKTKELVYAWHSMSRIGIGQESRKVNSHLFQYCRKERKKILSEQYSGEKNNFYGKKHSDKTKKLLSEKHKGKIYKTPEQIKSWVSNVAKKPKSAEHRSKIGRKGYVMLQNKYTLEIVRVLNNDYRVNSEDWINPRKLKPENKMKCDHCDIVTTASNLKRWHNDNCKKRKL
jgi:hypothetical protein